MMVSLSHVLVVPVQVLCKATDASYNVQPDTVKGIWNLRRVIAFALELVCIMMMMMSNNDVMRWMFRGINNNAWHRIKVNVKEEDPSEDEGA